jgi:uncharacterized repeat protein (TIGR02543 family)
MISNIATPDNQTRWYASLTGGAQLPANTILQTGIYYATQGAGGCESGPRLPVQIVVGNAMDAPDIPAHFTLCCDVTLADVPVSGNGITWYTTETSTVEVPLTTSLSAGSTVYYVARRTGNCESVRIPVTITVQPEITAPKAISPQTICDAGTIDDLLVSGNNIKWYNSPTSTLPLPVNTSLSNGVTYYATQSSDDCESISRTAVTVYIGPVVLDAPVIKTPQRFCGAPVLADMATDGSSIKWYDVPTGGVDLHLNTPLIDGKTYFAALTSGTCESINRTEVKVTIGSTPPDAPVITSSQSFCSGALVANLITPNNQIVWYDTPTGGVALSPGALLQAGTYYAAQRAGDCESDTRAAVIVTLGVKPPPPLAPSGFAANASSTLADIPISGSGIIWYPAETSFSPLHLTTPINDGQIYYAAQQSGCGESDRVLVRIYGDAPTVSGTVFPFVNDADPALNDLFPVIVKLTTLPSSCDMSVMTIHTTAAVYYDGSVYVPSTPKYPGTMGSTDNPGQTIRWADIGKTQGSVNNTLVSGPGDVPDKPVGLFTFPNVAQGDYLLHISRSGFLTRVVRVTITDDNSLNRHWELLAGDVNGSLSIDETDLLAFQANFSSFGQPDYNPKYDLNGDGVVNNDDAALAAFNKDATTLIYQDSYNVLNPFQSGITLNVTNHTFPSATVGYGAGALTPLVVTVANPCNIPTGALTAVLSGANGNSFELSSESLGSIRASQATFTVVPKTGLTAGTYTATVTVSDVYGLTANFAVSFSVNPSAISTYTVTYNANGGSGTLIDPNSPYVSGDVVTVLERGNHITNFGYNFTGWNTALDGSGTAYLPKETFTITENRIFYAQWQEVIITPYRRPVTIAPAANGAIMSDKLYAATRETVTLTILPDPAYVLESITVRQTDIITTTVPLTGDGNVRTFLMPPYGVTVAATFKPDNGVGNDVVMHPSLKAFTQNGVLYVSGLKPGATFKVFNVIGTLIYHGVAAGDVETQHATSLPNRGVYLVTDGTNVVKVVN